MISKLVEIEIDDGRSLSCHLMFLRQNSAKVTREVCVLVLLVRPSLPFIHPSLETYCITVSFVRRLMMGSARPSASSWQYFSAAALHHLDTNHFHSKVPTTPTNPTYKAFLSNRIKSTTHPYPK